MVCVYVRHPHASQATHHLPHSSVPEAAGELAQGALPTVQQQAPPGEAVNVDGGDVAVLGGHGGPRAQEHHLHLLRPSLPARTHTHTSAPAPHPCIHSGLWKQYTNVAKSDDWQ